MKKNLLVVALIFAICCTLLLVACTPNETNIVEVTDVTLNDTTLTLTEGDWETLTATITPSNATDNYLEWTTSNPDVVTVEDGRLYAVGEGEATITARSNNGKSATCTVKVEAEIIPPVQFTVTFHAEGGKFENGKDAYAVQVNENDCFPDVTVTRENGKDKYVFTTWYYDEYRTRLWDAEDVVSDDTHLYAGWKYLNPYQPLIDALKNLMKSVRDNDGLEAEILSVFIDRGFFCFVEKDSSGVFSYQTDIKDVTEIKENTELLEKIPDVTLTQLNDYNATYNSDNNALYADCLAMKYRNNGSTNSVVYSCVTDWMDDGEEHYTTGGPWYRCEVKAIFADEDGHVYDSCFNVVAGVKNYDAVLGGQALSEEHDSEVTALGEIADDFNAERVKEKNA